MRVILVGSREARARMRASLNGSIRIVGEFPSLTQAEAAGLEADGILLSPRVRPDDTRVRLKPDTTYVGRAFTARESLHDADFDEPLTPREIQVLELLAEGLPNKAIAERLGISDQTAKFHVASISGKLGAANRTDAIRRAVRRGLITL
jgi:DNA-binding NarL/FixJ family response regulator